MLEAAPFWVAASEFESPPSPLQTKAWELPSAACKPGKGPAVVRLTLGGVWKKSQSPNPEQMAAGGCAIDRARPGPKEASVWL